MRIVVTGRQGQVATALLAACADGCEVVALGRPALDLELPATVATALGAARPDVVVSAAAWTAVDGAESEPERARLVNAVGVGAVSLAACRLGVPVIHLSTDYVFDGTLDRPYSEDDPPAPCSVYGATKLAGEAAVATANADHVILRTAWIYSATGGNFVKTMLRLADSRDEVGVVADQIGNPTYADDIAAAVLTIARNLLSARQDAALRGVFHMSAAGETSWAGFAGAIFAGRAARGGTPCRVRSITTADYPTPARRPANSRLDCAKLARFHDVRLPPWQDGLSRCLDRLICTFRTDQDSSR